MCIVPPIILLLFKPCWLTVSFPKSGNSSIRERNIFEHSFSLILGLYKDMAGRIYSLAVHFFILTSFTGHDINYLAVSGILAVGH